MLNIVTWKWRGHEKYRTQFNGQHVNVLAAMVKRNYRKDHTFTCFTDDPTGIDTKLVEVKPLPTLYGNVLSPHGILAPSCYRRLVMFAPEAKKTFGERFVSLDLDAVIVNDMTPVWDRPEDFIIWGNTARKTEYNGSMVMMTAGARSKVFTDFDPVESPKLTKQRGLIGSDQAWISYSLGAGEKRWTVEDGVYSFRLHIRHRPKRTLPDNARVIFFHGSFKPWDKDIINVIPWIKEHWRS